MLTVEQAETGRLSRVVFEEQLSVMLSIEVTRSLILELPVKYLHSAFSELPALSIALKALLISLISSTETYGGSGRASNDRN